MGASALSAPEHDSAGQSGGHAHRPADLAEDVWMLTNRA